MSVLLILRLLTGEQLTGDDEGVVPRLDKEKENKRIATIRKG